MGDTDSLPTRPSTEGAAILQIAQELSTRIQPAGPEVQSIVWAEKNRRRVLALDDHPTFRRGTLFVSKSVEGKLDSGDRRALLAASIIYDSRLRLRRRLARAASNLGIVLVILAAYIVLTVFLSNLGPSMSSFSARQWGGPTLALFVGGISLPLVLIGPYMRHLGYLADRMTAEEFGLGGLLLAALRKIEALGLGNDPYQTGRLAQIPSVTDRIQKLSKDIKT